ncbi:glycosyltransferase [Catenisphaera adipataccumulans]|uniref:Glycosyltransferase involved in cell wall biosynthesis n=1 Tax=Catenisphaera adipataccumulans TaxID=700500 RepID=A0A7W8CZN2_9FIRM|nr:glycosyltransferase [Catenisphaera adipataccumulans]MBB5182900.1 glycosyltransferase involved in cell wall biosynthesis [Catenisphaera adipataccumulans]
MSVSVAMAVCNGEAYLAAQIRSILPQLSAQDELIVSVDPSTDRTREVLDSFQDQIQVFEGPGKGVTANFANALSHCHNAVIFLCDQDDLWMPDKVKKVTAAFVPGVTVVMHDAKIIDADRKEIAPSFFAERHVKHGIYQNMMKNSYIGCCMAFRKELLDVILPFPKELPMHDQYIGIVGEMMGTSIFLPEPLLLYRRHGQNASAMHHADVKQMLIWRKQIYKAVKAAKKKVKQNDFSRNGRL